MFVHILANGCFHTLPVGQQTSKLLFIQKSGNCCVYKSSKKTNRRHFCEICSEQSLNFDFLFPFKRLSTELML